MAGSAAGSAAGAQGDAGVDVAMFLVAAVGATSSVLARLLLHLARNPLAQKRARDECRQVEPSLCIWNHAPARTKVGQTR